MQFRYGEATLAGTLSVPPSTGPHAAVALIQGSGPADRTNNGYFLPIRAHLLGAGLAVLCFDKPGTGGSSGHWQGQSLGDRASEALAAVAFLRHHDAIDATRVGLWGFSQGGWVVPLAASRAPAVAFIIVVSGPGVSPAEQDVYDITQNMRAAGHSTADIERGRAHVGALLEAARRQESYERVEATVLRAAQGAPWYPYFAIPTAAHWDFFLHSDLDHDPVSVLEGVRCPVLAIFGERDRQVPAAKSAALFAQALHHGHNPDATIKVFAGADHGLRVAAPCGFAPGYLDLMGTWIRARVARDAPHPAP